MEIFDEVEGVKDHAARVLSEGLILCHALRKAVEYRWRLIDEIKQMSNEMLALANHTEKGTEKPRPDHESAPPPAIPHG